MAKKNVVILIHKFRILSRVINVLILQLLNQGLNNMYVNFKNNFKILFIYTINLFTVKHP